MKYEKPQLNNQELRILYALMKHRGKSSFDHMMTESGLCAGLFINHANELIRKGLIAQGDTFKEYVITKEGRACLKRLSSQVLP